MTDAEKTSKMPLQMPVEIFKEPDATVSCLVKLSLCPVITFQRGGVVQCGEDRMPPNLPLVAVCILVVCVGMRGWELLFLQERNTYCFATPHEYSKVQLQRNMHVMYLAKALYREWIIYCCAWLWKHFFSITFSIYLDTKRCNTCIHYGKCLFPILFWCWK